MSKLIKNDLQAGSQANREPNQVSIQGNEVTIA